MIQEWVSHPLTSEFLRLVSERQASDEAYLSGLIIDGPSIGQMDLHALSQLRGQIQVWKAVRDLKEFLLELTEDEVNYVEDESQRAKNTLKS